MMMMMILFGNNFRGNKPHRGESPLPNRGHGDHVVIVSRVLLFVLLEGACLFPF